MKPLTIRFLILILLAIDFINITGQSVDNYSIILQRISQKNQVLYDTLVPIEFLSDTTKDGIVNMQSFEGFNYPRLKSSFSKKSVILSNDTIIISISITPFDTISFKSNYLSDSILYFKSLYYLDIPLEIFKIHPFYPKTVISSIKIKINDKKYQLPKYSHRNLYNPNNNCWKLNGRTHFGINAYVVNTKIILTIECGEGAGFYIVVYVIDCYGKIEKKIEESVI